VPDLSPSIRSKKFSGFLVPDDSAHLHAVFTVTIRTDNFIGVGFVRMTLCPASDNLAGIFHMGAFESAIPAPIAAPATALSRMN